MTHYCLTEWCRPTQPRTTFWNSRSREGAKYPLVFTSTFSCCFVNLATSFNPREQLRLAKKNIQWSAWGLHLTKLAPRKKQDPVICREPLAYLRPTAVTFTFIPLLARLFPSGLQNIITLSDSILASGPSTYNFRRKTLVPNSVAHCSIVLFELFDMARPCI